MRSEFKIVFPGLFAGVNLILLDDVSESMLIPSCGPFEMYVGNQTTKVRTRGGDLRQAQVDVPPSV